MQLWKLAPGICFLFPVTVLASDALIYAAVYECNADEINQALVKVCSNSYPELAINAAEALLRWRGRNSEKAKVAKDSCEAELLAKEKGPERAEVDIVQKQISDIKSEIQQNFLAQLQANGKAVCIDAMHQLADGPGAMDFK